MKTKLLALTLFLGSTDAIKLTEGINEQPDDYYYEGPPKDADAVYDSDKSEQTGLKTYTVLDDMTDEEKEFFHLNEETPEEPAEGGVEEGTTDEAEAADVEDVQLESDDSSDDEEETWSERTTDDDFEDDVGLVQLQERSTNYQREAAEMEGDEVEDVQLESDDDDDEDDEEGYDVQDVQLKEKEVMETASFKYAKERSGDEFDYI